MLTALARLDAWRHQTYRLLGFGVNVSLLVIMAGVSADAILRYAASRPLIGTLEATELLLVLVVFGSLAATQAERGHIAVSLLTDRLHGRARAALAAFTSALGLILFAAITWATGALALRSWQMGEYAAGLIAFPLYPSRTLVTVGSLLLCLELALDLVQALGELRQR